MNGRSKLKKCAPDGCAAQPAIAQPEPFIVNEGARMNLISLASTVITFIFLGFVFRRHLVKGGPHLLLWSIGLLFYGLGTLCEVILSFQFHGSVLKLWYLCGAMLTAAWLGQGSIHLLVRKPYVAISLTALLAAASLVAAVLVFTSPVNDSIPYQTSLSAAAQYQAILGRNGGILLMTILLNSYGTLALIGCTVVSAVLFWRKHVLVNRMLGNILIAVGALMPAMGGTFVKLGVVNLLYLSEFVGVVIMYIGFLQATARLAAAPVPVQQVVLSK